MKRFFTHLHIHAIFAVFSALLVAFGSGSAVSALNPAAMDGMISETSVGAGYCMDEHHVVAGAVEKIDIDELADDEPQPPQTSYFTQLIPSLIKTNSVKPVDIIARSSYQPPDIVRLTNNMRF